MKINLKKGVKKKKKKKKKKRENINIIISKDEISIITEALFTHEQEIRAQKKKATLINEYKKLQQKEDKARTLKWKIINATKD